METKTIDACLNIKSLEIGRQMENNYRQIVFDCTGFGEGITGIMLVHKRPKDEAPYIVTTSDTDTLTWNISDTDTAYTGLGRAELRVSFENGLGKSIVYVTHIVGSITGDTVIPEPLQSWYDAMIEYVDAHATSPEQIAEAVADYIEQHPIDAPVQSVNAKTGDVVLTASDVGALPSSYTAPVSSVNSKTGDVILTASDVGALSDDTVIPTKTSDLQNDSGYITSVPVSSVNNKTGAVVLNASDVHALPDSTVIPTVPTNVSAFQNDAGYLTAVPSEYVTDTELQTALAPKANTADLAEVATSGDYADLSNKPTIPTVPTNVSAFANDANYITASGAPVQSVNGQTGAVTVPVPTKTSDLTNDSGFITSAPVASVDGKTGAVTVIPTGGDTGQVLAKASATDRDVEWITPSGGGGGESVSDANVKLAEGTVPAGWQSTDSQWVDTGLTLGDLRKYKYFYIKMRLDDGSQYLGFKINDARFDNGFQLLNSNGVYVEYTWLDSAKTSIMPITAGQGNSGLPGTANKIANVDVFMYSKLGGTVQVLGARKLVNVDDTSTVYVGIANWNGKTSTANAFTWGVFGMGEYQ